MSVDVDMQVGQHVNKFLNELEEGEPPRPFGRGFWVKQKLWP